MRFLRAATIPRAWSKLKAVLAAVLTVAVAMVCCTNPGPGRPPHVLLVTVDTLRADHCSVYGYGRRTSPTLERLARTGVLFETAYAPMATTAPSHATMLTGLLPREHGLVKNGQALAVHRPTLPQALQAAGYQTAAFVSSFVLDRRFGMARGFETYDDDFGAGPAGPPQKWEGHSVERAFDRTADHTRDRAVDWLGKQGYLGTDTQARPARPFFLWVHLFDPHDPYTPPPAHALFRPQSATATETEKAIAGYDGEIHFADAELGKLLDEIERSGLLPDTLVIVAGDHGEGLMDHGHMRHGLFIYEEAVRVPLLFHWPRGLPAQRRVADPVQLVDLAPTVLDLLALPTFATTGARSLTRTLRGKESPDPDRPVFLQRRHFDVDTVDTFRVKGDKSGVRVGRWKYIEAPAEGTYELFDLTADPGERRNLYLTSTPTATALARTLRVWRQSAAPSPAPISEEDARRLKSLGYVQ